MNDLSPPEVRVLVDELRKFILYQTPVPLNNEDGSLKYLQLKIPPACYETIHKMISYAGGWVPPVAARIAAAVRHDRLVASTVDASDGSTYNLNEWEYGDLVTAKDELTKIGDVPELRNFRDALNAEMARRSEGQ